MILPNFFIVGAAKSGTTSLYDCLKQHPDVFMPEVKEPHYFVDWRGKVTGLDEYCSLFSGWSGQKAVGEASTGYLFDRGSPARIKELIPRAKIIIMLREPVEMAFALWRHMRRIGRRGERLPFLAALEAEPARMADPGFAAMNKESWHGNFYYFSRGLYYEQVKRYMDAFGRDNVLVIIFDEFRNNPAAVCREVFGFLGVDPAFPPAISRHNKGVEVRHRGLARFLSKRKKGIGGLAGILNKLNTRPVPRLDAAVHARLSERYRPDVERLERLIGKDLSSWYRG